MTRPLPAIIAALLLAGAWTLHAGIEHLAEISRKEKLEREATQAQNAKERRRQCEMAFPLGKRTQQACVEGRL